MRLAHAACTRHGRLGALARLTKRSEQSSGGCGRHTGTAVYAWHMPIPSTGRARLAATQSFCELLLEAVRQAYVDLPVGRAVVEAEIRTHVQLQ
ncbi:hypothetical protein XAB3213_1080017 [Xanthomonas citri pv. bilvae]|nr:hypothetical protein XAB3213_1080017 [Xanthomonas citri pv. bilvae]